WRTRGRASRPAPTGRSTERTSTSELNDAGRRPLTRLRGERGDPPAWRLSVRAVTNGSGGFDADRRCQLDPAGRARVPERGPRRRGTPPERRRGRARALPRRYGGAGGGAGAVRGARRAHAGALRAGEPRDAGARLPGLRGPPRRALPRPLGAGARGLR